MSMLDVAKYLYFSKSIDLSQEKERYFNLSMVGTQSLSPLLSAGTSNKDFSPACIRGKRAGYRGIPIERR